MHALMNIHFIYKSKATNESLRSEAANYMLAHPDDFMPFLTKPDGDSLYTEGS